jgi:hypothetical protein
LTQSADRNRPHLSIEVGSGVYELVTDSKTHSKLLVRVRNVGHVPLHDVRLLLLGGNPVRATHWLRVEHDDVAPFSRSVEGELCPVGESLFFQVAETTSSSKGITLGYAHSGLPVDHRLAMPTDDQSTFVMLRAEGRRASDAGWVSAQADVGLFSVFPGPGGLRLRLRETVLPGAR